MSADRLAAYDGGPGVSHGGRSAIVSPRCDPHLRFDRRAMASFGDPATARCLACTHPPATSTDCPAASDGGEGHGDSLARRPGTDQPLRFPGRAPSEALSGHFATFGACHHRLCQSSAGGDGVPASAGNSVRDRPAIDPPPLRPCR